MRKKYICLAVITVLLSICIYEYIKIKNTKIQIELVDDLTIKFREEKKVSDFIASINGKIIDDYIIDSTKPGKNKIEFSFINDQNIKLKYSFELEVIDDVKPTILLGDRYNVLVNSNIDITSRILCGDNASSTPKCFIEGDFDITSIGEYSLTYHAIDDSGNETIKKFVLNVYEDEKKEEKKEYQQFHDILANYKTDDNKIGLDISSYQNDVDFALLKEAGVEFVIIRIGYGYGGKSYLDKKFKDNIKKATKAGLDVGLYYFSYATNKKEAVSQANWVLKQIRNYKITMPIAFDFEDWSNFSEYKLSFYELNDMAKAFLNKIKNSGYESMLYSSKTYLENIWEDLNYPVWLAHYTKKTDYDGKYILWQLCDNALINGIEGPVDVDIMY